MAETTMTMAAAPPDKGRAATVRSALRGGRRWLRAFRRTRPFWGALWLGLGGYWIAHFSFASVSTILSSGFSGYAGWIVGGGMMLCAAIAMLLPSQRYTAGLIGTVLSLVSLVVSNFGGFGLGLLLGLVGSTMMLAWGPKRPRRARSRGEQT